MFPMKDSPLHPYAVAGLGMYTGKSKFEADNFSEEETSDSEFGFRGGLGATWMFNEQFGLNAEADYQSIQTEGESTNFMDVRLGVSWAIPMAAK